MRREKVTIEVTQSILESTTNQIEKWQFRTEGDYLQLKTFEKITYTDQQNRAVSVKWLRDKAQLEISYETTQLLFNPTILSKLKYSTSNGWLIMDVKTKNLTIRNNEIAVAYQLLLENKPIGDYDFRLIYHQ